MNEREERYCDEQKSVGIAHAPAVMDQVITCFEFNSHGTDLVGCNSGIKKARGSRKEGNPAVELSALMSRIAFLFCPGNLVRQLLTKSQKILSEWKNLNDAIFYL